MNKTLNHVCDINSWLLFFALNSVKYSQLHRHSDRADFSVGRVSFTLNLLHLMTSEDANHSKLIIVSPYVRFVKC